MSCHAGPDIIENGLVFCYDMNNTQKSWRGKPTTNYLSAPTVEVTKGEFGQYYDLVSIFETYGLVPYSLSFDMKANKPGNVYWYMQNGSYTKYQFVSHNRYATTEWQRFKIENITPTGPDAAWQANTPYDHRAMLATYTGYGSGVNPIVKNIQLELGSFSTPFVAGTRSNTQAIIDLTGNNIITASNLTYNSDGSFSLDGTDDYFMTGPINGIGSSTTSFSMSVWVYPSSTAGNIISMSSTNPSGSWNMPPIAATGQQFFGKIWSNNRLYSSTYSLNTWYNLVLVFNYTTSGQYFYVNGNLTDSQTGITYGASGASNYLFFGQQNPGADNCGMFSGKIGDIKIYTNKALSAAEIAQNFNATRRFYGL